MRIGIGTYALFWESGDSNPSPLSIAGMIDRAAELDCDVFQICDDPRLEELDDDALRALRDRAELLGIELELGTRTVGREHLAGFIRRAELLGARTLRSMIQSQEIAAGVPAFVGRTAWRLEGYLELLRIAAAHVAG